MKTIIFFVCIVFSLNISAQLPEQNFEGILSQDNQTLRFYFKTQLINNKYITELYLPEQLLFAKKATMTEIEHDTIRIHFRDFQAQYIGQIKADELFIDGNWIQRGVALPLKLYFKDSQSAISFDRPQEPKVPFSYISKEINIYNSKDKLYLCGTLTLPDTLQKHTLAILITGSGPQNRNEELAGHKPFLVIADYLTRNGIAVFRYDDRGVGKSTGDFTTATTLDFMKDALVIVDYFKKSTYINRDNIGLIGHSEGGIVAMMAAAKNRKGIAYVVSLAGLGVPSIDLLLRQTEDILRASGAEEDHIELVRAINFQLYNLALTIKNPDSLMKNLQPFLKEVTSGLTEEEIDQFGFSDQIIKTAAMQLFTPWMKFFLAIKPSEYIAKIKCPVLALNGSLDIQVSATENLEAIERYLKEAKNKNFKTQTLPGLNHLFQKAEKGTINEYMMIQETFNEEALRLIVQFIKER